MADLDKVDVPNKNQKRKPRCLVVNCFVSGISERLPVI
jgi:hypothetical protein